MAGRSGYRRYKVAVPDLYGAGPMRRTDQPLPKVRQQSAHSERSKGPSEVADNLGACSPRFGSPATRSGFKINNKLMLQTCDRRHKRSKYCGSIATRKIMALSQGTIVLHNPCMIMAREQCHQRRGSSCRVRWHFSRASVAACHPGFSAGPAWAVAIGWPKRVRARLGSLQINDQFKWAARLADQSVWRLSVFYPQEPPSGGSSRLSLVHMRSAKSMEDRSSRRMRTLVTQMAWLRPIC
jgi:hypothetical protein